MQAVNPKLARTISWIAGVVAMVVVITMPVGYFAISYQNLVGELTIEAEINGYIASEVINENPEMWRFQQYKLEEFLSRRPRHGEDEARRILTKENDLIAESVNALESPLITESSELLDSGVIVGRIEISRSLRPLLLRTGLVGLLGLLLSMAVFATLKVLPLRALERALEDNTRLVGETRRNLERVRALHEIDIAITSTLDLGTVLGVLLEKIDLVLPYSAVTIRLFNRESGLLEPVACRNLDEEEWKAKQWRAGRGVPNVVFETRAPVRINNVQTDPRNKDLNFFRKHGLVSYLGAPLIVQGEVLGVISFYTKEEHEFSNEEIEFLTMLAGQAAIAIHNSQLYQEMVSLAAQLSRSNKARDEFLSVMSHELRTPLNVVMGYTGMMRDGLLGEINPEQEKALEKISSRARDQLTMISSILQATQLVAEGVKADRREVSLKDFLDDLRSSYSIPLGKEVSVIWDYSLDLPVVHTDAEKLKHVLQNLIDNAIKFTERGHVTISARIRQQATGNGQQEPEVATHASPLDQLGVLSNVEGRLSPQASDMWVEFKVSDTGIGIAEENFLLVFERFRQVDSSETRRFGGVGIGLYIVRKFTELLGGTVEVESEPGKGSTFTVTIPVADHQEAGKEEASERVSSR